MPSPSRDNKYRLEANIRDINVGENLPCKLFKSDGDDMIMKKFDNMSLELVKSKARIMISSRKTVNTVLLDPDALTIEEARNYLAKSFSWGEVKTVHIVGEYQIVEYHPRACTESGRITQDIDHNKTNFHPYINWEDTSHGYNSLDEALVGVIALKAEGPNGQAAEYFCKMIGLSSVYDD